jgi:cell division protein FtsB
MAQPRRNNRSYTPYTQHYSIYRRKQQTNQLPNAVEENTPTTETNRTQSVGNSRLKNADRIALLGVIVNAILAVFTYLLYQLSISAATSAKISADAAKKSADLQKTALDSQFIAKKESDATDRIKEDRATALFTLQKNTYALNKSDSKKRFDKDTTSIGLQIQALRDSREQFIKQNEPYLKVFIDSIYYKFNQLKFDYTIINLSNSQAKIISEKSGIKVAPFDPLAGFKIDSDIPNLLYVIKETPQSKTMTIKEINKDEIKWVLNGSYSIYWNCIFEYENLITGEKREYAFNVKFKKLDGNRGTYQSFSKNENRSK